MTSRAAARAIFDAGLAAGDVRPLTHAALGHLAPPTRGRLVVVGAGKASGAMAAAVEEMWGDRVTSGLVVVKDGHRVPTRTIEVVEAGHPVPDARGVRAARGILDRVPGLAADDLVLVLVSGGASSLTPAPVEPITLADKQAMTRLLLAAGADIHQLNAVRKHCSRFKGGQLARAASPAHVAALLLSDVIGDPPDVIGSGPTAPDASTYREAWDVLARFDLVDRVPAPIREHLAAGVSGQIAETPKPGDPLFGRVDNAVIGNNQLVVDAAARRAAALGYRPHVLGRGVSGEARSLAREFARIAGEIAGGRHPAAAPACVIAGGETTVTVRGSGRGGRCQEFALAAAIELDGRRGAVVLAAGTDGTDGPTDAAGAIADGETAARARAAGLDLGRGLEANDSNPVFDALGDLVVTGPTHTNLLDLYVLLVEEGAEE